MKRATLFIVVCIYLAIFVSVIEQSFSADSTTVSFDTSGVKRISALDKQGAMPSMKPAIAISERFKNIAQGVQAIAIVVAIVIGGIWALYQFRTLRAIDKAYADLDKSRAEVEKTRVDVERIQQLLLDRGVINISCKPYYYETENSIRYIGLNLVVENCGTRHEVINWTESIYLAAPVITNPDGSIGKGEIIKGLIFSLVEEMSKYSALNPGEKQEFPVLFPIEKHGLYSLEVCLKASEESIREMAKCFEKKEGYEIDPSTVNWGFAAFFDTRGTIMMSNAQKESPSNQK